MNKRNTYSLAKVAAELGISKTTVSFVVNGRAREKRISQKVERRVMDFCRDVGYRPNIHAQRINERQARSVGVLLERKAAPDERTPFSEWNIANVIGAAAAVADALGYRFIFQFYSSDKDLEKILDWFDSKEIGGLMFYGFDMSENWRNAFQARRLPIVGVSIDPQRGIPCVNVDNYDAARRLTNHLVDRGRKRFLYLAGSLSSYPGKERYRGFLDATRDGGLDFPDGNLLLANYSRKTAERLLRERWTREGLDVDAIVCGNDNMALAALKVARAAGLRVPEEVAVTGADDIDACEQTTPTLTTFDFLPYEQSAAAFKLLHAIINGEDGAENVLLKSTLRLRESA